jgi:hypothetical protein
MFVSPEPVPLAHLAYAWAKPWSGSARSADTLAAEISRPQHGLMLLRSQAGGSQLKPLGTWRGPLRYPTLPWNQPPSSPPPAAFEHAAIRCKYKTTRRFLIEFGLQGLDELPSSKNFNKSGLLA